MGSKTRGLRRQLGLTGSGAGTTTYWSYTPAKKPPPPKFDELSLAEVLEGLENARDRLRKGWLQGTYAKDARGFESLGWLPSAEVAWDATGACRAAVGPGHWLQLQEVVRKSLGVPSLHEWNDAPERTQDEVVEAFTTAIKETQTRISGGLDGAQTT